MTKPSLTELMAASPDGTLENIAKEYQVSLLDVINQIPVKQVLSGDYFDQIWDEVVKWGSVTLLVNSPDIIFEYQGELPSGFHRHGYFNLRGKSGLSGHIKAENCQNIAFVERKFMGMDTASIIFLNATGQAMFKIFVGRDSHHQLLTQQLISYRALAQLAQ